MENSTAMLGAVLVLLGYTFIHVTCSVLGHRLRSQVRRHDMLVEVHRRRQDYHAAATKRGTNPATQGDVIIEDPDDEPGH